MIALLEALVLSLIAIMPGHLSRNCLLL